jgi:PAS domain-containing protein
MKQIISAFLIGIMVCLVTVKSCSDKPKQVNVKEIKKEIKASGNKAETIHQNYQKEKQEFTKVADSLKTENEKLSVKLQITRALLKKQQTVVESNIPCDTLRKEVIVLNQLSNEQDSLCGLTINSLNQAVAVRDTQIVMCNRNYQSMFDLQKENLQRQQQLADELNTAYKQNRKKRFQNKMLSCGLMIMTGITTTLFIKSQK